MSNIPLYQEMRQKAGPLWQDIFTHAFVVGIGDGSLSWDRFEFYLKQDYLFWIDTCSSRDFLDLSDGLIGKMNAHSGGESAHRKEHLYRLYESSTRFEYLFFDMSWKKEEGPASRRT